MDGWMVRRVCASFAVYVEAFVSLLWTISSEESYVRLVNTVNTLSIWRWALALRATKLEAIESSSVCMAVCMAATIDHNTAVGKLCYRILDFFTAPFAIATHASAVLCTRLRKRKGSCFASVQTCSHWASLARPLCLKARGLGLAPCMYWPCRDLVRTSIHTVMYFYLLSVCMYVCKSATWNHVCMVCMYTVHVCTCMF